GTTQPLSWSMRWLDNFCRILRPPASCIAGVFPLVDITVIPTTTSCSTAAWQPWIAAQHIRQRDMAQLLDKLTQL
ncbi:Rpn family recombination-promoting nuclease/putative transposase, partial [Klebsiella pneumoniae]|nr:Rpn family recombination-promoting nuclease/putative transposase [Klebsiella pneumoniae]